MKNKEAYINDFVTRSFRDVADKDYIAARISHRYGLDQQFLWFAEQALEKYLKAILLYNRTCTKNLNHRLSDACKAVLAISDIPFDFPEDVTAFVDYLNTQGPNRYFEHPYYLMGEECLKLDRSVWHIRRYCYQMRHSIKKLDGTIVNLLPFEIKKVQHEFTLKKPHKYTLIGGYLETVLKDKSSTLQKQLVWKNFYYGTYKKKVIKNYTRRMTSAKPTHFLHPDAFEELDKLVRFSPVVRRHFKTNGKQKKG
jgi:HEPN domain-containing protein